MLKFAGEFAIYYPEWRLKATGRANAAGEREYIHLGVPAKEGYQGTPEGEIVWLKPELLESA